MIFQTVNEQRVRRYELDNDERLEQRGQVVVPICQVEEQPAADDDEGDVVVADFFQNVFFQFFHTNLGPKFIKLFFALMGDRHRHQMK